MERIVLLVKGRDKQILKDLVEAAVDYSVEKDRGLLGIYETVHSMIWVRRQTKKARPMDSVVLDEDISERLKKDIRDFQENAEWYISKGVPYRRGYLLYGPPGTGKTSFT